MSEPIQSIAQNNYILHNIDAKKLYVQEPLFTANSGDAVYVGWRPDETVLYSGNAFRVSNGTTFNVTTGLSENVSAFEAIKFKMDGGGIDTSEITCTPVSNGVVFNKIFVYNGGWVGISGAITGNGMSANIGGGNGSNAASCHTAGNWWDFVRVVQIVGINRKENA